MQSDRHFNFPRRQQRQVVTGGGSGGTTDTASSCGCTCLADGDIVVSGMETTSRWSIPLPTQTRLGDSLEFGEIRLAAGTYEVVYNTSRGLWVYDVGPLLTAVYLDGSNATPDTTMDGELTLELAGPYSVPTVKLCITGSVPDPGA